MNMCQLWSTGESGHFKDDGSDSHGTYTIKASFSNQVLKMEKRYELGDNKVILNEDERIIDVQLFEGKVKDMENGLNIVGE